MSRRQPVSPPAPDLTDLLRAWTSGNRQVQDRLFDQIYPTLRRMARQRLLHERARISIQVTDLVHEAYLRLVDQKRCEWRCRGQFFAIAATTLRRVLVDHAKRHRRLKRGPDVVHLALDEVLIPGGELDIELLALDLALVELAGIRMAAARVVELRVFCGLNLEDTASALALSPRTVQRHWRFAQAWLRRKLTQKR